MGGIEKKEHTEAFSRKVLELCRKSVESYLRKAKESSDEEWLEKFLFEYMPEEDKRKLNQEALELTGNLKQLSHDYLSISQLAERGISKALWLEERIRESAIGVSSQQYDKSLKDLNQLVWEEKRRLANALNEAGDGNIRIQEDECRRGSCAAASDLEKGQEPEGYYSSKEYARSIGERVDELALQMAAVTNGFELAKEGARECKCLPVPDIAGALETGSDQWLTLAFAGALLAAARRGLLPLVSPAVAAGSIAAIAFMGIKRAGSLLEISSGKATPVKCLEKMGRLTAVVAGGIGAAMLSGSQMMGNVFGSGLAVVSGLVCGIASYLAGRGIGEKVYAAAKKTAKTAGRLVIKVGKEGKTKLADKAATDLTAGQPVVESCKGEI